VCYFLTHCYFQGVRTYRSQVKTERQDCDSRSLHVWCSRAEAMFPSTSIALSGSPGSGKSTIAELAKSSGWEVISVEKLAEKHELLGELDKKEQAKEIDIEKLRQTLGRINGPLIVDGHLSHYLQVDAIVILRCKPSILRERLQQRGYPEWKIESNVEWEIIGSSWSDVENENVAEFETSSSEPHMVWSSIQDWINTGHPTRKPFIDWMND
ncbi:MAG: adenylate kinase family protein, partial [Candidatus Thermoplasmatota archaeon]|nr:adenylate kinase family protein [Candidatus Thermoplasmatota archaeon]